MKTECRPCVSSCMPAWKDVQLPTPKFKRTDSDLNKYWQINAILKGSAWSTQPCLGHAGSSIHLGQCLGPLPSTGVQWCLSVFYSPLPWGVSFLVCLLLAFHLLSVCSRLYSASWLGCWFSLVPFGLLCVLQKPVPLLYCLDDSWLESPRKSLFSFHVGDTVFDFPIFL